MKLRKWLDNWDLTGLSIKTPFLEMEWAPATADQEAAWDMYIELLTRVTTQALADEDGVEQTALDSIYALFDITRGVLKDHGKDCVGFARLAIVILNQIVRPFTARWHPLAQAGAFADPARCRQFRDELRELQRQLTNYARLLAEVAGVEDLTGLVAHEPR